MFEEKPQSKKGPKKSLGQHFLRSQKALSQIVDAADPTADDIVLEIGPGEGVLTERLLALVGKVIAIEKDRDLIPLLSERFENEIAKGKLDIIEADVLDFDTKTLSFYKNHTYKLVANIPYYITGAIFEKFLSAPYQPTTMVVLIQKEVAERIVTKDKKESVLSLSVKAYGTPTLVAKVPAGAFAPAPKVDSAILAINDISRDFFKDIDEQLFFKIIKKAFGGKRKQIQKTLGEFLVEQGGGEKNKSDAAHTILDSCSIALTARPETLHLYDWKKIVERVQSY